MELRQPPRAPQLPAPDRLARALLILNLVMVLAVGGLLLFAHRSGSSTHHGAAELDRQVASKLKSAGALDEAAPLYERYLALSDSPPETRAKIAYSLGEIYLRQGANSKALRWFYEADTLGAGDLANELGKKIVHTLELLGRHHAAQTALDSRVHLDSAQVKHAADDPVVAKIGKEEIYRSDLDRALDDLPPELARSITTTAQKKEFLKKYVAEELLWRKAQKLEYDRDPEVLQRQAEVLKQLAVNKFVEKEVVGKIQVDEADLKNFFAANKERYSKPADKDKKGKAKEPTFDEVRSQVERDYRLQKIQAAYNKIVESELSTKDVQLFPERVANDA